MGATITKKNFFSRVVAHPGGAVTLAALMRLGGWGYVPNALGQPTTQLSADSFTGDACTIIPNTATIYVGDDEFVRNAAGAGPPIVYQGVPAIAGQPFSLTDYCRGVVAADDIYVYSVAGQDVQVVFDSI